MDHVEGVVQATPDAACAALQAAKDAFRMPTRTVLLVLVRQLLLLYHFLLCLLLLLTFLHNPAELTVSYAVRKGLDNHHRSHTM